MALNNIIKNAFVAPWWAKNCHLQTLWASLFRQLPKLPKMSRYRLELDDGDFIDVDIFLQTKQPTLLLLHGLEGSVNSHYIRGMIDSAVKKNWQVAVMHFRSCSGEPNRLVKSYNSGVSDDLQVVLDKLKHKSIIVDYIVGYSLGGNVLLKWLGEQHLSSVKAAVAVSVPLMLDVCATEIHRGFSRFYEFILLRTLRQKTREKQLKFSSKLLPKMQQIKNLKSFWQFDDQVTAPVHGYLNASDYYKRASSRQFVKNIKIKTLIIQSRDDPFMSAEVLPKKDEIPESVTLEENCHGGHVGFVQGQWPWKASYYLESRIPQFLEAVSYQ